MTLWAMSPGVKSNRHGFVTRGPYGGDAMREYRSEFSPEHGVWVLKRVPCQPSEDVPQAVPVVPAPGRAQQLRLVESKPVAHT